MNANHFKKRIYPNIYLENKISGAGIISILDEPIEGEGFYDLFTGEKVELPITELDDLSVLAYMADEQAAEYFADENHLGWFDVKADERNGLFDEDEDDLDKIDPEKPTNPDIDDSNNTDDSTDNPDNEDREPVQPPTGEDENDTPSQPTDDSPDNPADTTPDTPQPPQKPSDGNNSGDDDYTPPVDYYPVYYPVRPSVTVKPTENDKPQEQPDTPAPAKPQLTCNGAVIDTSRTVVLLGYGDGLLHEGEPLTRAQLATIVFRLLDDASIARYSNTQVAFTDVAADAWYAPYVNAIGMAGIVNGVGNGKYDPDGTVTWSQILAILSRFVEPQDYTLQHIQYSGWAVQAIQTAVANGWIADRASFTPDAVISRGQLEQLINGVLALYR